MAAYPKTVQKTCTHCRETFDIEAKQAARGRGKYCSRACCYATRKGRLLRPSEDRFWPRVKKTETCWVWTGGKTSTGYGSFKCGESKGYAHRYAYELLVGPIPEGLQIDHLCRNRRCVRPDHLETVTQQENMRRGIGASARNAQKTHCPAGHPYSGENLLIVHRRKSGLDTRQCRACITARKLRDAALILERNRARKRANKERDNARRRDRYATDPEYRERTRRLDRARDARTRSRATAS